jgi:L-lactate dehydrogenase complex protein LldF
MAMKISNEQFKERVDKGIHNDFMRGAVSSAQDGMGVNRSVAAEELGNWEEWRSHGEEIRQHVLENLDYYLEQLSENVAKRGEHVFLPRRRKRPLVILGV